jgi:hypothetical protein
LERVERVGTYIVVLDGEENEALRVFLQERLVCLLRFDGWCDSVHLLFDLIYFVFFEVRNADDGPVSVLLVCR